MLLYFHPQCLLNRGGINKILHLKSTETISQEILFFVHHKIANVFIWFFQCTCDTHLCNSKSKLGVNKVTVMMMQSCQKYFFFGNISWWMINKVTMMRVQSCQKYLCYENISWYISLNCTTLYYSVVQYSSNYGDVENDFFR